jgi:glycosyltransferase involved in cell wall biosynthesis
MDVSFLVPSASHPIGGVLSLYEFANGLRRRGHRVHLVHIPAFTFRVSGLDDLGWFTFEPGVEHHFLDGIDGARLPDADFIFGYRADLPRRAGLPLIFVQGTGIFAPAYHAHWFRSPCPKVIIARWLEDVVRGVGVPPEQVTYVPYGLDHEMFRLVKPIAERPLQVAMLYHWQNKLKGAPDGLAAMLEVQRRIPGLKVILFSPEDPEEDIPSSITYITLPSRRVLVDHIYNDSRVFLCSSIKEGFGFCAIEAMAGGCALVSTANGGSDDYAFDGDTALVCAAGDVQGMADRIERLLLDDHLRTSMAARGQQFVQGFDWDRSAELLERFLQQYGEDPARYQGAPAPEA